MKQSSAHYAPDPSLLHLVTAAEREENCPVTYVLAGGWFLQGVPVSSRAFLVQSQNYLYEVLSRTKEFRNLRGSPVEKDVKIREAVAARVTPLGDLGADVETVLTMSQASAYPPGAPMIHMPVIRVPLHSIATWWIAGYTVDKPGSSLSFGVIF
jgi:hypothetical protein